MNTRFTTAHIYCALLLSALAANCVTAAPNLPQLADPQQQVLLTTLQTEFDQYLANQAGHFVRPAETKTWPCALTPAQLNKLAGTTNSDDDPLVKRGFDNYARSWRSTPIKMVYSNQVFYPVKAACKAGKLEGPVEFWVEFDVSNISANVLALNSHQLQHVQLTAKAGEATGIVLKSSTTSKQEKIYADPATTAMMKNMTSTINASVGFSATQATIPAQAQPLSVSISYIDIVSAIAGRETASITTMVSATRPLANNRAEEQSYWNGKRYAFTLYKNGRLHGEQLIDSFGGNTPTTKYCWEDGEKILANPCVVD